MTSKMNDEMPTYTVYLTAGRERKVATFGAVNTAEAIATVNWLWPLWDISMLWYNWP